jgi:hypothetical protein
MNGMSLPVFSFRVTIVGLAEEPLGSSILTVSPSSQFLAALDRASFPSTELLQFIISLDSLLLLALTEVFYNECGSDAETYFIFKVRRLFILLLC